MNVHSPETPGRVGLRLDVYSPPQVLQIHGRLCHLILAFLTAREATNSRAPLLHGHCSASSLIRNHPPPSCLAGTRRASPVAWRVLAPVLSIPPRRGKGAASVRFRRPMLPSPSGCGLGPRFHSFSRPHSRSLL